jgi:DNA-binding transcriptional LysR family regulator
VRTRCTRGDLLEHTPSWWATARARCPTAPSGCWRGSAHHGAVDGGQDRLPGGGLGHGFLPRACVRGELARGTLVELKTEEPRPPEAFWLGWKTGLMGEALKWWVKQLNRQLVPALLPRSV